MTWEEYLIKSEETLSLKFNISEEKERVLKSTIDDLLKIGNNLDKLKKSIFYGTNVDFSEFPKIEKSTFKVENSQDEQLLHFIIGHVTESIELLEIIDKVYFKNEKLDEANLQEELGDSMWYTAGMIRNKNYNLYDILKKNIKKLNDKQQGRYKNGSFSQNEAENRNLNSERNILEEGL